MSAEEFIKKWVSAINYLGLPSVGIHRNWDKIEAGSKVIQYSGRDAWNKIFDFTTPWFKNPKTFKYIINNNDPDYRGIVLEEIINGKIQRMATQGLPDPQFCAFADSVERITILGDGNHRFLNCNFLISLGRNFDSDINNTELDVIRLDNFNEVIEPQKIWKENYNLT